MKTVKIKVDLDTKEVDFGTESVLSLTQQLRLLKKELQTVPQDSEQFQILSAKFRDTEDALKQVNVRSRDFFSALGTLPGIVGFAGRSIDGLIDTFKIFGSLKLTDLKVQLKDSIGDLKSMAVTIGNLTGITKAYTVINTALAASFVKVGVGEAAAAAGARAFAAALTATGVGALVVALGLLAEKLIEVGTAYFDADKEARKFKETQAELDIQLDKGAQKRKEQFEIETNLAKQRGASELELAVLRQNYLKEELKTLEANKKIKELERRGELLNAEDDANKISEINIKYNKIQADLDKQASELRIELSNLTTDYVVKKREEEAAAAIKLADEAKKQRDKDLAEIEKNAAAARLTLLAERDREVAELVAKYSVQMKLAAKYGKDVTVLQAALDKELLALREKFKKEDIETAAKLNEEKLTLEEAALDLRKSTGEIKEEEYQLALRDLRIKYANDEVSIINANADFNAFKRQADFNKEVADLTLEYNTKLAFVQDDQVAKLFLEDEFQRKLNDIKIKYAEDGNVITEITAEQYNKLASLQAQLLDTTDNINTQIAQSWIDLSSTIGNSFRELANIFEAGSDASKIFGVVSVIINAASAIGRINIGLAESIASLNVAIAQGTATIASGTALLSNPITAVIGAAQLAAGKAAIATASLGIAKAKTTAAVQKIGVGITSAAQIAAILGAKKQGAAASGAGGGGGTTGGQASTPSFATPSIGAPQIGPTANQAGTIAGIVAGAIGGGQSGDRPLRAYVVGNEITTQQQLSRRLRTAARLGG